MENRMRKFQERMEKIGGKAYCEEITVEKFFKLKKIKVLK